MRRTFKRLTLFALALALLVPGFAARWLQCIRPKENQDWPPKE